MKDSFKEGLAHIRKFTVDTDRTIGFMGEDCRVYGTPELIRDIEWTCRDLMFEHSDPGEDSVGINVAVGHSAPTLLGMDVDISVTVAEIDGNRVVFDVSATDPVDTICAGQHERFVVDVDKTRQRLANKAKRVAETA